MKPVMGMGTNRTGIGTSPIDAQQSVQGAAEGVPNAQIDGAGMAAIRADYVRNAESLGSVPPPTSVKGVAKSAMKMVTGKNPAVLLDKLSQRLAFERTGTRLYEALIAKIEAEADPNGPPLAEVRRFHDEERQHLDIITRAIETLGGDPTVQTPSADLDGVASMGLLQVITDPRTSVTQSLHAIHIAELADNDGWAMLIDLAGRMGHDEMVREFTVAANEEVKHLAAVRQWMTAAVTTMAGVTAARP